MDDIENSVVDGFINYLYVDENTRPKSNAIVLDITNPEDIELNSIAEGLKDSVWKI